MRYLYRQEEMAKRAFDFIYGCALHDAILQKAFKGEKTWVGSIKEPKDILSKYIDKVLNNEFTTQEGHDEMFLETANAICRAINSKRPGGIDTDIFSFGNAQKLINITVKHIYTFCYHTPSLRECFRFCHCPVDAILLGEVWKLCKGKLDIGKQEEFCKAWGSEGIERGEQPLLASFPARYSLFQNAIRFLIGDEDMFSIEFDYVVWKS